MRNLAVVLLLAGVVRHFAWGQFTAGALVWNLCGAAVICLLLGMILRGEVQFTALRHPTTRSELRAWGKRNRRGLKILAVTSWWVYEELLVGICSAWRIFDWWPVAPGEEQCSARIGIKLGAISLVAIGALVCMVAHDERE